MTRPGAKLFSMTSTGARLPIILVAGLLLAAACSGGSEPNFALPGESVVSVPKVGAAPSLEVLTPITTQPTVTNADGNDYGQRSDLGASTANPVWSDPARPPVRLAPFILSPRYDIDKKGAPEPGDDLADSRKTYLDLASGLHFLKPAGLPVIHGELTADLDSKRFISVGPNLPLLDPRGVGVPREGESDDIWEARLKRSIYDDHGGMLVQLDDRLLLVWLRGHDLPETPDNAPFVERRPSYLYRATMPDGASSEQAVDPQRISDDPVERILGVVNDGGEGPAGEDGTVHTGRWIVYVVAEPDRIDRDTSRPRSADIRAVYIDDLQHTITRLYIPYEVVLTSGLPLEEANEAVISSNIGTGSHSLLLPNSILRNIQRSEILFGPPPAAVEPVPMQMLDGSREGLTADHETAVPSLVPSLGEWSDLTDTLPRGSDHGAAPSPDGTRVAFHRGVPPLGDLWMMNIDGTEQVLLVDGGDIVAWPGSLRWSPDGSVIGFSRIPEDITAVDLLTRTGDFRGIYMIPAADAWNDGTVGATEIVASFNNRVLYYDWSSDGMSLFLGAMSWAEDANQGSPTHQEAHWTISLIGMPGPTGPLSDEPDSPSDEEPGTEDG